MRDLTKWASKWGVPRGAIDDLREILGALDSPCEPVEGVETESDVQNAARVAASATGARLWRNNVGAGVTPSGSYVRYGLANDSPAVNKRIKSADLIGIKPVTIGPDDVGRVIGQFIALEVKAPGWAYRGSPREEAQQRFLALILALGGDARFISSPSNIFS